MAAVATIGTINLSAWRGSIIRHAQHVERIARDGLDGAIFRLTGTRGEVANIRVQADATNAVNADALEAQFAALAGTLTNITDPFGRIFGNVMVYGPVSTRIIKPGTIVGGSVANATYVVQAVLQIELTEDAGTF